MSIFTFDNDDDAAGLDKKPALPKAPQTPQGEHAPQSEQESAHAPLDIRVVEAVLFAAEEPLSLDAIATILVGTTKAELRSALGELTQHYEGRGFSLVERGGRWHFQTAPEFAHILRSEHEQVRTLSRAATEVLAIIAYHEPVSRAEVEAIRGVQTSAGTLSVLIEAGWVRAAGRREVPGRPIIYVTTPAFLQHFGLESRRDLPGIQELRDAGLLESIDEALDGLGDLAAIEPDEDEALEAELSGPLPSE